LKRKSPDSRRRSGAPPFRALSTAVARLARPPSFGEVQPQGKISPCPSAVWRIRKAAGESIAAQDPAGDWTRTARKRGSRNMVRIIESSSFRHIPVLAYSFSWILLVARYGHDSISKAYGLQPRRCSIKHDIVITALDSTRICISSAGSVGENIFLCFSGSRDVCRMFFTDPPPPIIRRRWSMTGNVWKYSRVRWTSSVGHDFIIVARKLIIKGEN
jgi:hypothetical protein